ncbi:hypothetical protein jhhlp_002364 [Lomentospora prolificans]|uniref:Cytidine deaminase n=1 Tax=Lomentospora prolificans TaxID=41688 RepID=A0A2N3NDT4_9PEZI|nr:hypothetical protein jhhlp_002364 [Lomentospora prolificans]
MDKTKILNASDPAAVAEACKTHSITTQEFTELQSRSTAAKATAYCPYSQFRVGATLLIDNSEGSPAESGASTVYVSGANVENASYPVGTCAERVAFGTAVVSGFKRFRAIAVATDVSPPSSPCGMCRQFIREFCGFPTPIFMFDKDGNFVVMTMEQLLPVSFGPDALPSPEELLAARAEKK